jgi:hypothetical protein
MKALVIGASSCSSSDDRGHIIAGGASIRKAGNHVSEAQPKRKSFASLDFLVLVHPTSVMEETLKFPEIAEKFPEPVLWQLGQISL